MSLNEFTGLNSIKHTRVYIKHRWTSAFAFSFFTEFYTNPAHNVLVSTVSVLFMQVFRKFTTFSE